jgi:hypothetical protein
MAKKREHRFADARTMRRALLAAAERSLPQARRVAGSQAPDAPASLKPRAAQRSGDAGAGSATWGDFEGLNATHMVDRSRPPPAAPASPMPTAPQKQRLVAPAPRAAPPSLELDAEPAPRPARKRRKTPEPMAAANAADALDPLYAGAGAAAPDIDYERVRAVGAVTGPSRKAQVGMQERRPSRPRGAPPEKVRYRRRWGHWVLPLLAVGLVGYLVSKPALRATPRTSPPGQHSAAIGSAVARAASQGALGDLPLPTKGRRKDPGSAPPHMRDVVF